MTRTILIKVPDHLLGRWIESIQELLPEFGVVSWLGEFSNTDVEYIIGWAPDANWVNKFDRLKALISIGSGVDHIVHLDSLRESLPVIRTVSDDLSQMMREFVASMVLSWHRRLPEMMSASAERRWEKFVAPLAPEVQVGILGYGRMGQAVAHTLAGVGYSVRVWALSERQAVPFRYYTGPNEFGEFLQGLDVLVCLLPLTTETEGLINQETMEHLKDGSLLINVARGGHVVDKDVLAAIESGKLSYAVLDSFRKEPLPLDSPFWGNDRIFITGHSSAFISASMGPPLVARSIREFESGNLTAPVYNPAKGY